MASEFDNNIYCEFCPFPPRKGKLCIHGYRICSDEYCQRQHDSHIEMCIREGIFTDSNDSYKFLGWHISNDACTYNITDSNGQENKF